MASIYSVNQVNSYIKNMFAQDFLLNRISVRGEISNCKYHTSGHIYFTLKDGTGTLSAVMFSSRRKGLSFALQEGQQVVVTGSVEVYERDGKYQLYAQKVELAGQGDLYERYRRLLKELEEMGMFAPEYKQPIPRYAARVGVVTAGTGAAIQDIVNITRRRNPYVQLILYPALVQGDQAAASITAGIRTLDTMGLDVLIVGRGGGSMEDLWAFNEELVARAIFDCSTPVISAVGHETDVTIADYVADLRAPTPSAAAELAVFDYDQFAGQLAAYKSTLERGLSWQLERRKTRLDHYRLRLKLHDPVRVLNEKRQHLDEMEEQLQQILKGQILTARHRLALAGSRLHGLSPLAKISKGFGFLTNKAGRRIERVGDVKAGEPMTVRVTDGTIRAVVTEIDEHQRERNKQEESDGKIN